MRVYVGFDDTDTVDADRGTGKLARWFEQELPEGCPCGAWCASSFWLTRPFPIPPTTAQPAPW